ncbi:flagellar hook-associated protein FlgL [Campylobacter sp. 2018MI35]|uniref:flagellar hook-associated protein FlgL n=1 Tax=Campylobacter molothri TaxID=1032242 RepID=UPI001904DEA1|nr:flagellar hook-associated protein FlgL [Campylobacter sp. 2018MI35]MBK2000636.1 flagellar hook-associated protein FlgL [Campylobacter sp. 2018MI35]
MRITNKLNFTNSVSTSMGGQSALYKISQQLASGLKIQNSYEDASTYIDNTRLEYELKTLEQVKQATSSAKELTENSMKALQDMVKLLEDFKVKVTQAASDSNSQTSREAIAKELQRIKESILQLANTSVNGQYLFAGSQVANKPFDSNGNYYGDKNNINVVTGSGTESPYNIPGWDLFFKADGDYKKQITTNISFKDNRYTEADKDKQGYLNGDSAWKQLIGQNYVKDGKLDPDKDFEDKDQKLDFPPSTLYVQGTKPDGTSFKSAVLVKPDDKIEDVLEQIGALYGNTAKNKVVEVSINNSGQIQITDLKQGNNKLDFHAVAYTPQMDTTEEFKNMLNFAKDNNIDMNEITNKVMEAAIQNGDITNPKTPVEITLKGKDGKELKCSFNLAQTDFIKSNMTDSAGNKANGADYDNVYFEKDGNTVYGNVSQVIKGSNAYATDSTKLSEVMAGDSLNGTTLNLKVNSKGGNTYDVTINLGNSTVSFKDPKTQQDISFPIMHTDPTTGNSGVVTPSNEITYGQINNIIGMFAADKVPTQTINQTNNKVSATDYDNIQQLIKDSQATVDVSMDYKGRISVTDKLSSGTNIGISLSDSQSGHFPVPPYTETAQIQNGPNFSFSANNALTIDEPNVDLIKDLDTMIDAVLSGNMRADGNSADPRNTGMQGALERLDHLADHVSKLNTTMGAYHNIIDGVNTRVSFLSVNVQSIKSNVIDVDYGEAMMNLMQTQLAYQASLKASTTISQLSLLNYM